MAPMLDAEVVAQNACRGRGKATCGGTGGEVVVVGTDEGSIAVHDFARGDGSDFNLGRPQGSEQVGRVWVDPNGAHCLATTVDSAGRALEVVHVHLGSKKVRQAQRLKQLPLSAVAWNRQHGTESSTGPILVGGESGNVSEAVLEEGMRREKSLRHLASVDKPKEEACDAEMEVSSSRAGTLFTAVLATPTRLFVLQCKESLGNLKGLPEPVSTAPEGLPQSRVALWPSVAGKRADSFAWLRHDGVLLGRLPTGSMPSDTSVERIIPFPHDAAGGGLPLGLGMGEFHAFVLFASGLYAVNILSGECVESLRRRWLGGGRAVSLLEEEHGKGGTRYVLGQGSLLEVTTTDEGRDMWWLHCQRGEYARALELARSQEQRDQVHLAQAEEAMAKGERARAAALYARAATSVRFEDIALRLSSDPSALRLYLLHRLDRLGKHDRAQATMLATWLAELYLEEGEERSARGGDAANVEQEFQSFMEDHKNELDGPTTRRLLAEHGREQEVIQFASLTGDHATVLSHHISKGDARSAISAMRKPGVPPHLKYKHAPALFDLDPTQAVDFFISAGSSFDAQKLLPCLTRPGSRPSSTSRRDEALRLLNHWFKHSLPGSDSTAVRNFAISLYAQTGDESSVLRSMDVAVDQAGDPLFDREVALRACLDSGCHLAAVHLYASLGSFEEAVDLALRLDADLAKRVAEKPEEDESLRKSLWLRIARHSILSKPSEGDGENPNSESVREAIGVLEESDGLLRVEDVLPLFPDFTRIGEFKDAVVSSLEEYNRQIESLRSEVKEATSTAEDIRADIERLSRRTVRLPRGEPCSLCGEPAVIADGVATERSAPSLTVAGTNLLAPFYAFPCGMVFHSSCLLHRILPTLGSHQQSRARHLLSLTRLDKDASDSENPSAVEELERLLASECPLCGDFAIRSITEPLVKTDDPEIPLWKV